MENVIEVMSAFGYSKRLLNLIRSCISIISFSLMINGNRCDSFMLGRGIW